MIIYYTHKYKEMGFDSHKLLEFAIGDYISDTDTAGDLVSRMKRDCSRGYEGRPYIEGFDQFSISHSDNTWAVLIDKRRCGLDIQYERRCDVIGISRRFFHPRDAAFISGSRMAASPEGPVDRREFFRIWTRREALVKATGESVVYDDIPSVGLSNSAVHEGATYYLNNIELPDARGLYTAICIDASEDINERLVYKEMYVRK